MLESAHGTPPVLTQSPRYPGEVGVPGCQVQGLVRMPVAAHQDIFVLQVDDGGPKVVIA